MPNTHNPDVVTRYDRAMTANYHTAKLPLVVFDIETGVRRDVLREPEAWFRPDARLKDPDKIAADIKSQAADKGALSPVTGRVLAIGYSDINNDWCVINDDEREMVEGFLNLAHETIGRSGKLAGWNSTDFDVPFLLLRAKILGLQIPASLGGRWRDRWQLSDAFVDLMGIARFGRYDKAGYSLDKVARAFGIEGKNGDGALFADLLAADPAKAREYLLNDIRITRQLAEVLL